MLQLFNSFISISLQKLINVLAGIRMYWWEKFSKINKRTGTTIPDSRVSTVGVVLKSTLQLNPCCNKVCRDSESKAIKSAL